LANIYLATDRTSLTGTQLATLTVNVHLVNREGVAPAEQPVAAGHGVACPCAQLSRVGNGAVNYLALSTRTMELSLASGTAADGIWSGSTQIGAEDSGTWAVSAINDGSWSQWKTIDGSAYDADVTVTGTNWPEITIDAPTRAVPFGSAYEISGSVTYADSGSPVPDTQLLVEVGNNSQPVFGDVHPVTTDQAGRWQTSATEAVAEITAYFGAVEYAPESGLYDAASFGYLCCPYRVRWGLSLTAARSGRTRDLIATVTPRLSGADLQLQRFVSRRWIVVDDARRTGHSGSYRFVQRVGGLFRVLVMQTPSPYPSTHPFLAGGVSSPVRVS
jgi:hypothetical protein